MPNKRVQKSHVNRLTIDKEYKYPWQSSEVGDVEFTYNFNTAYYMRLTFKIIKGSSSHGGNYYYLEQNDEYRISKY
ncbi:MAG: hypothetical protein GY936_00310 [Ignavibacteriae bacterium]|nr:hypothetical protein [Ignavibacteriota bacterium]